MPEGEVDHDERAVWLPPRQAPLDALQGLLYSDQDELVYLQKRKYQAGKRDTQDEEGPKDLLSTLTCTFAFALAYSPS